MLRISSHPGVVLLLATILLGGPSFISLAHGSSVIITTLTASLGSSSTNWNGAAIELTPASGANNGIAFAVAPSCSENDPSGTTVSTGSFTTTPGDVIVMVVGTMHGPIFVTSSKVQDSLGNAYTLTTGDNNMEVWTATARSSGSDTITFTNSASGAYYAICAAEYSGATVGTNTGTGTGTGSLLREAVQVAASTSWLVGGFVSWRTPSITMSSPDNQRQSDVNPNLNIIIGDIATAPPGNGNTHSPILINSDAGFTSANGVTGGTGTASDPYTIQGWNITTCCHSPGIQIGNTTAHFVIRNVIVHYPPTPNISWCSDCWSTFHPDQTSLSVVLMNVTNGEIDGSQFNTNPTGGMIQSSRNILIHDSLIQGATFGSTKNVLVSNVQFGWVLGITSSENVIVSGSTGPSDAITSLSNKVTFVRNTFRELQISNSVNVTAENNKWSYGVAISGSSPEQFDSNTITPDNMVTGGRVPQPILFYKDCSGLNLDSVVAGELILANCYNVSVRNVNFKSSTQELCCVSRLEAAFVSDMTVSNVSASLILVDNMAHVTITQSQALIEVDSSGWVNVSENIGP
ncbi:MAG TPA: hypothetical protein VNA15_11525, partial [Candidatus Angelobacter sp.]|nr:hypothetical protein [Candidatus Angelobacter sp.]